MNALVAFALRQRAARRGAAACWCSAAGVASFPTLNIEAYPDPVPPLVDIVTQSAGQSAEEIERYITIPIEIQMAGIPHVQAIRTISLFGLSDVKVQFTYDFTYEQAEQWVINRLSQLPPLPNGAQPQISPTSPIGEIFRYRVVGPAGLFGHRPEDDGGLGARAALQGGARRDRRHRLGRQDQDLRGRDRPATSWSATACRCRRCCRRSNNTNINVGGQTVNIGPQSAVVRGVGLIHSMDDIRHTLLATNAARRCCSAMSPT